MIVEKNVDSLSGHDEIEYFKGTEKETSNPIDILARLHVMLSMILYYLFARTFAKLYALKWPC